MNLMNMFHKSRGVKGFSLVETVLAIGIVSFALTSLLALIPIGLTTFRNASTLNVEASIAQRLAGELQRTDFENQRGSVFRFYFDEQGIEVAESSAVFTAEVQPPQALETDGIISTATPARVAMIHITNAAGREKANSYSVILLEDLKY